MSSAPNKRRFTLVEYVALETDSPTKHEFYQGEIFAMAGASPRHNRIVGNIYARLHQLLEGTECEVYGSDQRIRINASDLSTYADVVIVCGDLQLDAVDRIAATNPRIVIEVLSPSTEKYDRGKKFEFYQQLDSLAEYVLVAQDEPVITQLARNADRTWRYGLIQGIDAQLQLVSLPMSVPLSAIYRGVQFGPGEDV